MARVALGCRCDVIDGLTRRSDSIVAVRARRRNTRMVEACGNPGAGRMTSIALRRRWHVSGRFSGGLRPVVAGRTTTRHTTVIEIGG